MNNVLYLKLSRRLIEVMQSVNKKIQGLKQVKIDNWGTFFLQRLLQLYFNEELLDLTIKFHSSDKVLKVHRLVIVTCTDYFLQLEREQNGNDCNNMEVFMPIDMPYESVKSIIRFMYTGQLEYWASEQYELYHTAQKMNISVLTKLLDAQMNENITQSVKNSLSDFISENYTEKEKKVSPVHAVSEKRSTNWKRKSKNETTLASLKNFSDLSTHHIKCKSSSIENTGPSRFDLPEIEDLTLGVFSSFDDITYNTKPIAQAPENICGTRQINNFSDNNVPTAMLAFCGDENYAKHQCQGSNSSDEDWIKSSESVFKCQNDLVPALKKVKFDLDEKENISKPINECLLSSAMVCSDTIDNHAKIIREVLKKYPHLVQHNKNIRLKITQKESKNSEFSIPSKTKVSYVVLKSDSLITNVDTSNLSENLKDYLEENGPWRCSKCNLEEQYTNYYMYRRHMQDVHSERFDPRICEHCGYKATKRNILMYHMFTKHNVSPPKSMSFPKCHVCSYIALSESLLIRHQTNHKHGSLKLNSHDLMSDSICCSECKKNFNDVTELASHEITSGHGTSIKNKDKGHYCFYCGKHFIKDTNLKVHIDCFHKNLKGNEYLQDMLNFMQTSSKTDTVNPTSDTGIQNTFQNTQNVSEFVKMSRSQTESVCTDLNDQNKHIIVSMNKEKYQDQNVKEFPLKILKNNQIFIEDSERNTVVHVQNADNTDIYQKVNYKCSQNNDEIVEEVVEELESIEDSKQEHVFNCSDIQNIEATSVALINEPRENSFNLADPNTFSVGDAIQYVEEETEILEYETSINV